MRIRVLFLAWLLWIPMTLAQEHRVLSGIQNPSAKVAYVTDLEGSGERWKTFLQENEVVFSGPDGQLELRKNGFLVFGGDALDRGSYGMEILEQLLSLKQRYPGRVTLIAGNRDLNKIQLLNVLRTASSVKELQEYFTRKSAAEALEARRAELQRRKNGISISDEEVVQSFRADFEEGGIVRRYLQEAQLAVRINRTVYVHGGIGEENFGRVPGIPARYDTVDMWFETLNRWYRHHVQEWNTAISDPSSVTTQKELTQYEDYRASPEPLQSVITFRYMENDLTIPRLLSTQLVDRLNSQGIYEVICGHTPVGEQAKQILVPGKNHPGVRIVFGDHSYSSHQRTNHIYTTLHGTSFKNWVKPSIGDDYVLVAQDTEQAADPRESPLLIRVRGAEGTNRLYLEAHPETQEVRVSTSEKENENTLVHIEESLTGRDVRILLPVKMDANQKMEALIQARIAHGLFARSIRVLTWEPLDAAFLNYLAVAGANEIEILSQMGTGYAEPLKVKSRRSAGRREKTTAFYVGGIGHPDLEADLMRTLQAQPLPQGGKKLRGTEVFFVGATRSPVNETFLDTLQAVARLKARGAVVHLITPYLPYARSDKMDRDGVGLTGRLIADLIESVGTDSMTFVRAHAPQSQGFFRIPTFHIPGRKSIESQLKQLKIEMVISPDAGFQKDASVYAKELGVPVRVINKERNLKTGEIHFYNSGPLDVQGRVVAIIDDETATGGTLAKVAAYLKESGAKEVIAVVTHLAGNAREALESSAISRVVTTDTIPVPKTIQEAYRDRLMVLQSAPEIGQALKKLRGLVPGPSGCGGIFGNPT